MLAHSDSSVYEDIGVFVIESVAFAMVLVGMDNKHLNRT